jgi:hypothetical protein
MSSETSNDEGDSRRFDVALFVVHPSLRPDDISQALALEPHFTQTVGLPRATPSGTPLSGTYPDTRWRHKVLYTTQDQHFADQLADFVDGLKSRGEALAMLRATGGKTMLIVQFLGDGYLGDDIPHESLSKIVELGLGLGIECFVVPQG